MGKKSAKATAKKKHRIQSSLATPTFAPQCADFSNLGTTNPKILNSCKEAITVGVVNFKAGQKIGERIFHLTGKQERPLAFPGDYMVIEWEKEWARDCAEDASKFLHLYHHDLGGSDLWEIQNNSPDRYAAFECAVYENGKRIATAFDVLEPGQKSRLYAFDPPSTGFLFLEWSCLEPD